VIDVSDPTNPFEAGYFDTGGDAWGVAVSGCYVYVADGSDGLYILRYLEPVEPKPDLIVTSLISFLPEYPTAMQETMVNIKIRNIGNSVSSSGNVQLSLLVLDENSKPFEGEIIDIGMIPSINPGEMIDISFPYRFISNSYSRYLELTLLAESSMDAVIDNNTTTIEFIPNPNEDAYWNCVSELTTILSVGFISGEEDIKFIKDILFYAWNGLRNDYYLFDVLNDGDIIKAVNISFVIMWDTGTQIFKLAGKQLIGKVMAYIKLFYSTVTAAINEGKFLGCGEVVPSMWNVLKEMPKSLWDRIKATGESVFFFILDSPADIIIEDSSTNMTSVIQNVVTEGIENSFGIEFEGHKAITIIGNDTYTMKVMGTETGVCGITVYKPDSEGNLISLTYKNLPTTDDSKATLIVSENINGYTLNLDKDGDGVVDEIKVPDTVTDRPFEIVNSQVILIVQNVEWDPTTQIFSFNIALNNIGNTSLIPPIITVVNNLYPAPPTVTINNPDGGGNGIGGYWEYSDLVGADNLFSPGETSEAKTWEFYNPNMVGFYFSCDVYAVLPSSLPKAAATVEKQTLTFYADVKNQKIERVENINNESEPQLPTEFALEQNYPNPFNAETMIKYQLPQNAKVQLSIFNLLGQEIRTLVSEQKNAGYHTIVWNGKDNTGKDVVSGVYVCRIKAGEFVEERKMVVIR